MRHIIRTALATGFIFVASANTLFAVSPSGYGFTFDENGNGTAVYYLGSPLYTNTVPFQVGPDPSGGITTSPVLIYFLPVEVTTGDLAVLEPDLSSVSDLIRFMTPAGSNTSIMIFYSDMDGPNQDLADVGIPPISGTITGTLEYGTEGNNQAFWSGDPGGPIQVVRPVGFGYGYTFISDVPEPASALLLSAGVGVFFVASRFRRKRFPARALRSLSRR